MRYSYHTEQWVPHPVERVFNFFANTGNLPSLMPAWQHARIEKQSLIPPPPRPKPSVVPVAAAAGAGSHVTLSFRPFPGSPLRLTWQAEISEFTWNEHFCDSQIKGPFTYWKHCHYIRRANQPGIDATVIADDVEYEIPFGLTGELAHRLVLRRRIERTFTYRQNQLARMLALVTPPPQPLRVK